jgi:uncharacterized RDD family membrane protein YckC
MPPPPPPPPPSYTPPPAYGPPPGYGPTPGGYPPPPAYGGGTAGPVAYGLASFGQRVGATLVDFLVIGAIYVFGIVVAVITTPTATFENPEPSPSALGGLVLVIAWIGALLYPIVLEGRPEGQTIGKRALGIRVVRKSNGAPLGYPLSSGRFIARFVEGFTFGLGLLWAAWDPMHQTFHDKMAGTLVVRTAVYPPPRSH